MPGFGGKQLEMDGSIDDKSEDSPSSSGSSQPQNLSTVVHTITAVPTAIPNQPVQVQSVIQPTQQSVIQAAGQIQTVQVEEDGEGHLVRTDPDIEKRREILSRRPSYRKILNELSSAEAPGIAKIEEDKEEEAAITSIQTTIPSYVQTSGQYGGYCIKEPTEPPSHQLPIIYGPPVPLPPARMQDSSKVRGIGDASQDSSSYKKVTAGQTIQIAAANQNELTTQGLQTITMTNAGQGAVTAAAMPAGTTIVQYTQGDGSQQFVTVPAGEVQAYQIRAPSSLPAGVVMATPTGITSPQQLAEESARKRELRLMKNRYKNRVAARECRKKKKEYVKCLENRVAVLEQQNKALIEELKQLKDLYCHKNE
ncbi:cyclic AMP-responsive element-binding protein 1-like isoform X6 [Branchiostoma floridae]|uniref:Cyclic AMP-responsive element-binding protein 1-like isoform X6 n=1 Tax=Branchiostoma floridae TaxID=7739 RepID=A0A9J7LV67_BRAFL|nr:cyclic AMP-responsive element-binding protein 1-like isoform X6 [Branchiostoma floridae]